jgi:hypothetical protein
MQKMDMVSVPVSMWAAGWNPVSRSSTHCNECYGTTESVIIL